MLVAFFLLCFRQGINYVNENDFLLLANPDNSVLTNTNGLINYTCDSFEYIDWSKNGRKAGICLSNSDADHGSYTRNNGAKVRLNFVGTKIHILAWKQENSGKANIKIDDQIVGNPSFNSGGGRISGITFTSDDLAYGPHTIEIEHNDTDDARSMVIGGAYVDPLPKIGGYKLSYENFGEQEGKWTLNKQPTLPQFTCDSEDCSGIFRFYGSRFWLTGVRSSTEGNLQITIDDGQPITISKSVSTAYSIGQGNAGVLLYQSNVLQPMFHKVKVQRTNQRITLNNLFYTTNDNTQIPLPPVNTSIMTNPTGLINLTCDKFEYTDWDTGGRGGADHGSYTRNTNGKARLEFVGSRVHILAWKQENSGNAEIRIDDELVSTTNFNSGGTSRADRFPGIVFSSSELQYGHHTLEVKHKDAHNTRSVVIGGAYVDPLPYYGGYALTLDGLIKRYGTWETNTDTTPPTFGCESEDCAGTFVFYGTRFWLTGLRSSSVGKFDINIDGGQDITINVIRSEGIAHNNIPILLYQSDELEFKEHEVRIYKKDNSPIKLVNFFYTIYPHKQIPPPTPTPVPAATPTETVPADITITSISQLPTDRRYEQEIYNGDAIKVTIFISEFNNLYHQNKGGAIHIVNGGLVIKDSHFNNCESKQGGGGAIYLSNKYNYKNVLDLRRLQFNNCKAQYGGAIYLYSDNENVQATIDDCTFDNTQALATKENSVNGKYGGSAIFLTSINPGVVTNCQFRNSNGVIVNFYNHFENSNSKLLEIQKAFKISECLFEVNKKSENAVYFDLGNNSPQIEVYKCTFKGTLPDGSYFFDGKIQNVNGPKLTIKKCKFASSANKIIFNEKLAHIDLNDQTFNYDDAKEVKNNTWKIIVAIVAPAVVVVVAVTVLVVIFTKKRKNPNHVDANIADSDVQSVEKTLNAQLL